MSGWIGVDLDGTLAIYDHWRGEDHIGAPIVPMVERVQRWLEERKDVRIFTARASLCGRDEARRQKNIELIQEWTRQYVGWTMAVTSDKDLGMIELWDDRAIQVEVNTGRVVAAQQTSEAGDRVLRDILDDIILADDLPGEHCELTQAISRARIALARPEATVGEHIPDAGKMVAQPLPAAPSDREGKTLAQVFAEEK